MFTIVKTVGVSCTAFVCLLSFCLFLFIYLCSLECLYLGGNFIKEIPPELANLPSLNYLVLCDNKIQSVPPQLSQWVVSGSLCIHRDTCLGITVLHSPTCFICNKEFYSQSKWYMRIAFLRFEVNWIAYF